MKYVKLLGLAAMAAMALMAFAGAGTASATTLCKATETPCTQKYPAKTKIVASLESGTLAILRNTSGSIENECTGSETNGETENESGATIHGPITKLTFTGCTDKTEVTTNGSLEVSNIAGTENGTVTAKNSAVTMILFGVTCTYGAGGGTDLGTLTGGAMATMDINAIVHKTAGGFLCPETAVWEAKYTVTKPEPLYVEP